MSKKSNSFFPYLDTIGLENIAAYFRHANTLKASSDEKKSLTWVSVGSGTGEIEFRLSKSTKANIICIDPEEKKEWQRFGLKYPKSGKCIKPKYKYTKDLISEKKDLVGNCGLLLIWPEGCGSVIQTYDVEAITLLEPRVVLLVYETGGGSGGPELHKWMRTFHPDVENLDSSLGKMIDTHGKDSVTLPQTPKYNLHSFYAVKNVRGVTGFLDDMRDEICIVLREGEVLEKDPKLISGMINVRTGKEKIIAEDPHIYLKLRMMAMMNEMFSQKKG